MRVIGIRFAALLILMLSSSLLAPARAAADAACEKKFDATGAMVLKSDPKTICDQRPSVATQDCTVELLDAGKGKLRRQDLFSVFALCKVDPSKEVRDCFISKLPPAYNSPTYKPAQKIGDQCLMARKRPLVTPKASSKKKTSRS